MQIQTPKVVGAKSRNFLFATLPALSRWLWNRAILLATWLSNSNDDDSMSTWQRNSLTRITRWWCIMVAFLCVCWNHTIMIAFRCACRPQTMMISWWCVCRFSVELTRCRCVCRHQTMMISWWCVCRFSVELTRCRCVCRICRNHKM
jgi:hypothetical protein